MFSFSFLPSFCFSNLPNITLVVFKLAIFNNVVYESLYFTRARTSSYYSTLSPLSAPDLIALKRGNDCEEKV
jgi:hypothetical protein